MTVLAPHRDRSRRESADRRIAACAARPRESSDAAETLAQQLRDEAQVASAEKRPAARRRRALVRGTAHPRSRAQAPGRRAMHPPVRAAVAARTPPRPSGRPPGRRPPPAARADRVGATADHSSMTVRSGRYDVAVDVADDRWDKWRHRRVSGRSRRRGADDLAMCQVELSAASPPRSRGAAPSPGPESSTRDSSFQPERVGSGR